MVIILGTFDEILSDFKENSYAKHHIGQSLSGQPAHEVLIGQHIFTKIPLPRCDYMHPIICGVTHQQSKQYSRYFKYWLIMYQLLYHAIK